MEWIKCSEQLPERPKYDWVLVIARMSPEGYYGVPHVAELINGKWQCTEGVGDMEEILSVKVTHWMPLPEPPAEQKTIQIYCIEV